MELPDIELVSAEVHAEWNRSNQMAGVTSRKLESGEELMVPYEQLSEQAKDLDRMTVQTVYRAILFLSPDDNGDNSASQSSFKRRNKMGYDEVKTREQTNFSLDLPRSVASAVSSFRDDFRHILGSEPIVEKLYDNTFRIATYGGGEYQAIGQFSIGQLPGCCGVVVFYHSSVTRKFTGRGLGRLFLRIREKAAILAGYTMAQATVISTNEPEIKLLKSEGWNIAFDFVNKRTKNNVSIFIKGLN